MTIAVLAEKPSVARDISRVLGANRNEGGVLTGNGYAVTWAVGHLVGLAEPHQLRPEWKRWQMQSLPMIPDDWQLEVADSTKDRFEVVRRVLRDPDVTEVVCATDAGREGELIFRYIYEAAGAQKPVKRLWVSSLTADAIRDGFANLRDGAEYDGLADAARGRSRADWLVGMNLSRAYTLIADDTLSVGRVQTPTLAMLVERELAIRQFVPEDYREVVATFAKAAAADAAGGDGLPPDAPDAPETWEGTYFRNDESATAPAAPGAPRASQDRASQGRASQEGSAPDAATLARRLPADDVLAQEIVARARAGRAEVESVESKQRKLAPPLLYDLTELQRHANRLFGLSAAKTLQIAQSLYETHKLLSYPRTDSRYLSKTVAEGLGPVVEAIRAPYVKQLAPGTGERPLGKRYVDDARVTEHHALIPTTTRPGGARLSRDEARVYDLVCRRLLSAWHEDHLYSTTTVITAVSAPADAVPEPNAAAPGSEREVVVDRYRSSGTMVDREGWKALDYKLSKPAEPRKRPAASTSSVAPVGGPATSAAGLAPSLPPGLVAGLGAVVRDAKSVARKTRPPNAFTDSTLLTGMETAGRTLDDKELSDAMRATGLGTPATRASIIETLIHRGLAERRKKAIVATDKGIALIAAVHPDVRSPRMTGQWESRLAAIQRGEGRLDDFMAEIERYVRDVVQRIAKQGKSSPAAMPNPPAAVRPGPSGRGPQQLPLVPDGSRPAASSDAGTGRAPASRVRERTPPDRLEELLRREFGFDGFRPYQEAACRASVEGRDVLLVMPTGAGKSLCYQLPGIALAGTTLVISPLIALMEDQVAKLVAQGFAAERIHSGRKRAESQAVLRAYLAGALDFLFIAPERLAVPGFPERLATNKPALIAIDEAHCISQWGHDFRPDYRMLGERLPQLRPAPIIALTATATPLVQRDIVKQLGVRGAERHIHGFRRDNIFIEQVELAPGARDEATAALLAVPERRPAIVYAPTRKKAEALAATLAGKMRAAAYHAGIATDRRDRVQSMFLAGQLDVIVATIAFGMGIDKSDVRTVVHTALPASVEGYYQEIGRAGRDGKPSSAVLYHSYADRRTHEWFLDRDYPEPALMKRLFSALSESPQPRSALSDRVQLDPEILEKAVEKLWLHGGALVDGADRIRRGSQAWEASYDEQRKHKRDQLDQVCRMAEARSCHMLQLVRHFGDQADSGKPCGHCASCAPEESVARAARATTAAERRAMTELLDALRERDGQSKGRIHRVLFGDAMDRGTFENLLGALLGAQYVVERADSFENEGELIQFQRLYLTDDGRRCVEGDLAALQLVEQPKVRAKAPRKASGTRRKSGAGRSSATRTSSTRKRSTASARYDDADAAAPPAKLVSALRAWRAGEAKKRRCPAFRIMKDTVLIRIASETPHDEASLLGVNGMGPTLVKKYGDAILRITAAR